MAQGKFHTRVEYHNFERRIENPQSFEDVRVLIDGIATHLNEFAYKSNQFVKDVSRTSAQSDNVEVSQAEEDGASGGGGGSGGSGGSGIVILSYITTVFDALGWTTTGGTKTTDGLNTVHTFTSSGTFTLSQVVANTNSGFFNI